MLTLEDLERFGFDIKNPRKTSDFILLDDVKANIAKTLEEINKYEEERDLKNQEREAAHGVECIEEEEEEAKIEKEIDPEEQKRLDEIRRQQEEQRKRKEAAGVFKVMNEQKAANDFLKACTYSNSEFNVAIISSKSNHHALQEKNLYIKRIFTEFEDFDIKMMTVSDLNIPCPFDSEREAFQDSAVVLLYEKNACVKPNLHRAEESIDVKRKLLDLATSIGLQFVFKNAYENGFYFYKRSCSNLPVHTYSIDDVSEFLIPESQVLNVWIDGRRYKANACSQFLDELISMI